MKKLLFVFMFVSIMITKPSLADLLKDFDSLGSNKVLLDKVRALEPEKKIEVVQDRIVNRVQRHELLSNFEMVQSGGNSYLNTQMMSLSYHYHINPRWSVGLSYGYAFNQLTTEGDRIIQEGKARQDEILRGDPNSSDKPDPFIPELNWMRDNYMAQLSWYPVYGKFNFLNKGVVHFDLYTQLGVGQARLRYNDSILYQAALGFGFWWSQNLTSRLEYKYSTYTAEFYRGEIAVETGNIGFSIGYFL